MTAEEQKTPEIQEEGISIWLALLISLVVLALGVFLVQSTDNGKVIPASGKNESAFMEDVYHHTLDKNPTLDIVSRDPRDVMRWQQEHELPPVDMTHLGLRYTLGASAYSWNSHPVALTGVLVEQKAVFIYTVKASWLADPEQKSFVSLPVESREILSWNHGDLQHVAIPLEPNTLFPPAWKNWLLKP